MLNEDQNILGNEKKDNETNLVSENDSQSLGIREIIKNKKIKEFFLHISEIGKRFPFIFAITQIIVIFFGYITIKKPEQGLLDFIFFHRFLFKEGFQFSSLLFAFIIGSFAFNQPSLKIAIKKSLYLILITTGFAFIRAWIIGNIFSMNLIYAYIGLIKYTGYSRLSGLATFAELLGIAFFACLIGYKLGNKFKTIKIANHGNFIYALLAIYFIFFGYLAYIYNENIGIQIVFLHRILFSQDAWFGIIIIFVIIGILAFTEEFYENAFYKTFLLWCVTPVISFVLYWLKIKQISYNIILAYFGLIKYTGYSRLDGFITLLILFLFYGASCYIGCMIKLEVKQRKELIKQKAIEEFEKMLSKETEVL